MSKTLGIVACPILEDELVYDLSHDAERKNIFLLDNRNAADLSKKLRTLNIQFRMLDQQQFMNGMVQLPEEQFNVVIMMNDMGLHSEPTVLRDNIRDTLLFMASKVDAIALYYGLCGNANQDVEEWAASHIEKPVTIFKDSTGKICDDCIAVAVDGTKNYYDLQKKYTGLLYYTPAMATKWKDFLKAMELFRGVEDPTYKNLKYILDYCGYKQVLKVETGLGNDKEFERSLKEFAKEFNLDIVELEPGWVSLAPTERIYAEAKASLEHCTPKT